MIPNEDDEQKNAAPGNVVTRLLARVDQVGVEVLALGVGPDAENPIF